MSRRTAYSGKFLLRVGPELHARLAAESRRLGRSLNEHCVRLLAADHVSDRFAAVGIDREFVARILSAFPTRPLAIVLFGSVARRDETGSSDLDLLVVFPTGTRITRSLYRALDERLEAMDLARDPSPHLVALPAGEGECGGLWLEAAKDGIVVHEEGDRVSTLLGRIREAISRGELRRGTAHGHPYWIREEDRR